MAAVELFLVTVAAIFLIGILGEVFFRRTGVPDVIWLMLAGIIFGPLTGLVERRHLEPIAPLFATLALVVVLFDGGLHLKLSDLSRAAARSSALAVIGFVFAALAVCGFTLTAAKVGLLPASWGWPQGLLLGAILGGSSSDVVLPAMRKARVSAAVANLVNVESALTDVLCIVAAGALIGLLSGGMGNAAAPVGTLVQSLLLGAALGIVAGVAWMVFQRFLRESEYAYPITLSSLLILYVVANRAGGSAALAVLAVAIVAGNAPLLSKLLRFGDEVRLDADVEGFHRQLTFIIKSFFFTFVGLMVAPPWSLIGLGILLAAVLLVARLPATWLSLAGTGMDAGERRAVLVAMPRGMASGVLAMMLEEAGLPGMRGMSVAVYACVIATILVFAVGLPLSRSAAGVRPDSPAAAPDAARATEAPTG